MLGVDISTYSSIMEGAGRFGSWIGLGAVYQKRRVD